MNEGRGLCIVAFTNKINKMNNETLFPLIFGNIDTHVLSLLTAQLKPCQST